MRKIFIAIIALVAFGSNTYAQVTEPKDTPQLEFALQLKVTLGETYSCGETQHGQRIGGGGHPAGVRPGLLAGRYCRAPGHPIGYGEKAHPRRACDGA